MVMVRKFNRETDKTQPTRDGVHLYKGYVLFWEGDHTGRVLGKNKQTNNQINNQSQLGCIFKSHVLDTAAVIGTVAGTADRCLLGERRNVCAEYDIDEDWCAEQRGHSSTP